MPFQAQATFNLPVCAALQRKLGNSTADYCLMDGQTTMNRLDVGKWNKEWAFADNSG
ncbi:MAG: hypothetical protein IRZ13_19940 [Acetobacteraceae bacterium]|nr:hypothetical protein [Acetobacteraceae bacterium]